MRSGLDYLLDQIKAFTKTKPPYSAAFTTQALYLLNQCVPVMVGLNEIIQKQKAELEEKKPVKIEKPKGVRSVANPVRNESLMADQRAGMTQKQLSEKYKISMGRVSQIIARARAEDERSRVARLPVGGNPERQGLDESRQEAGHSANANGVG